MLHRPSPVDRSVMVVVCHADHYLQNQMFRHIFIRSRHTGTNTRLLCGTMNVWNDATFWEGFIKSFLISDCSNSKVAGVFLLLHITIHWTQTEFHGQIPLFRWST
jgi:hypothetical protein